MSRIIQDPDAKRDLLEIWLYISRKNLAAADAVLDSIDETCQRLADNPRIGQARPELARELRSISVGNYVLFFRPLSDGIELIRVLHGARDIEAIFREHPK